MEVHCAEFNKHFKWLINTAQSCSDGDAEVLKAYEAISKIIRYNPDQPVNLCKNGLWAHREIIMAGNVDEILNMHFDLPAHNEINVDHIIGVLKNAWPQMDSDEQSLIIKRVQNMTKAAAKYERMRRKNQK